MSRSRVARLARDASLPSVAGIAGNLKTMVHDDDDPTNGAAPAPEADEMIQAIQLLLSKMPDQQAFLEKLAALVSEQGNGPGAGAGDDGLLDNNREAVDRGLRRQGRRFGARPAQDAAAAVRSPNHSNFLKRFPDAAKVDAWR